MEDRTWRLKFAEEYFEVKRFSLLIVNKHFVGRMSFRHKPCSLRLVLNLQSLSQGYINNFLEAHLELCPVTTV